MFYYLDGIIEIKAKDFIVIDVNGVGYMCKATLNTIEKMAKTGEKARIYTYLHVREDIFDLYGFESLEELNCFKMLISVSKIGPKVALSILSEMNSNRFAIAVATNDINTIKKANGVGLKMAQRIILELKDKITKENLDVSSVSSYDNISSENVVSEAIEALAVLGYNKVRCQDAISKIDISESSSAEEIIKKALGVLAKN